MNMLTEQTDGELRKKASWNRKKKLLGLAGILVVVGVIATAVGFTVSGGGNEGKAPSPVDVDDEPDVALMVTDIEPSALCGSANQENRSKKRKKACLQYSENCYFDRNICWSNTNCDSYNKNTGNLNKREKKCARVANCHFFNDTCIDRSTVVDCVVSKWSDFSECDKACGTGTQNRSREILVHPENGGKECPHLEETVECNTASCIQCVPDPDVPCPVNCQLSVWSDWTECTRGCEGGMQNRSRTVVTEAAFGGTPCDSNVFEERSCNEQKCLDCIGVWEPWSPCNATCGGGTSVRKYVVFRDGTPNGGEQCPNKHGDMETELCNEDPCPVDCNITEWSDWSPCTLSCGEGGTTTRTRTIIAQGAHGGKECPTNIEETKRCNDKPCPINCMVGPYGNWSSCSKVCGGGTATRVRDVLVQPFFGGEDCPSLVETKDCNIRRCDCTARIVAGIDYTYQSSAYSQHRIAMKLVVELLDYLRETVNPSNVNFGLAKILPQEIEEVFSVDTTSAMLEENASDGSSRRRRLRLFSTLGQIAEYLLQNPEPKKTKSTDYEGFFETYLPAVSKFPEREGFLLLMSDGIPAKYDRKFLLNLYANMDRMLDIPNRPTILCFRTETYSDWTNYFDKYCDVLWTHNEGWKERSDIAEEIANYICPPDILQIRADPCASYTAKDKCKSAKRMSDGRAPGRGERGFSFCWWNDQKQNCAPRTKYYRLFNADNGETGASNTTETPSPSSSETGEPTLSPTSSPSKSPTKTPTRNPTTASPTEDTTVERSESPTKSPTKGPTKSPTKTPTKNPTKSPTKNPTKSPTKNPTKLPTKNPTTEDLEEIIINEDGSGQRRVLNGRGLLKWSEEVSDEIVWSLTYPDTDIWIAMGKGEKMQGKYVVMGKGQSTSVYFNDPNVRTTVPANWINPAFIYSEGSITVENGFTTLEFTSPTYAMSLFDPIIIAVGDYDDEIVSQHFDRQVLEPVFT